MTELFNDRRLLPDPKRPEFGELDRFGNIGTSDPGARLVRGACFIKEYEVERALSFGWSVVPGVRQPGMVLVERQLSKAEGTWRQANVRSYPQWT